MINEKLKNMGIELRDAPAPLASYIPAVRSGELLFTSGQLPMKDGALLYTGKVGSQVSPEEGYEAARQCAINCLSAAKGAIGDLELVDAVVKVTGFVNSAPGFTSQPGVVNGASDFFVEAFGESGRHARSAVGVAELPLNTPVEIEAVFRLKRT